VIVLLYHDAVPMLACVPDAIFTWLNPKPGSEETQAVAKTKTSTKTKNAARPSAKTASRKPKTSSAKSVTHKGHAAGVKEVTVDRRRSGRRDEEEKDTTNKPATPPVALERRKKVNRRRQIDPTTCERDYTDDEVACMNALDNYKRMNGRMFPTCSEVLEVVRSLGYVRLSPNELTAHTASEAADLVVAANIFEEKSAHDWQ
jgi:hypothetical protein